MDCQSCFEHGIALGLIPFLGAQLFRAIKLFFKPKPTEPRSQGEG